MTAIEQITEAAQKLTPNEIRARLSQIDQEARILRTLLRTIVRGDPRGEVSEERTS